jgi:hypothetical protein
MDESYGPALRVPGVGLAGGAVWILLVASRLLGVTQLTLIDSLFLLAPLVIAPLGLRLIDFEVALSNRLLRLVLLLQPIGAGLAVLSFLLPKGSVAAGLAAAWLLVCGIAGLAALLDLLVARPLQLIGLARAAAVGYLAFGAVWLVLSRAGIAPLGLSPLIVELTAVHFHFTGFAATLLAVLILRRLRDQGGASSSIAASGALLMVIGSPVLAAGWGTPVHLLQVVGAIIVASGVFVIAGLALLRTKDLVHSPAARILLRMSALAPLLPMLLALEYSAGRYFGFPTLDLQQMALVHGDLNSLGFSLLGLLAWTLDRWASRSPQRLAFRLRST